MTADENRIFERLGSINAHLEAIAVHLATLNGRVGRAETQLHESQRWHEAHDGIHRERAAFDRGRAEVFISRKQLATIIGAGGAIIGVISAIASAIPIEVWGK